MSREAHVLVALGVVAVRLEYKGESVAWRQDGVVARVMPISRILKTTKLFQDFSIMENLRDNTKVNICYDEVCLC